MASGNLHLLFHNIVSVVSTVALFGMALFTYLNGPRKAANVAWALVLLSVSVFTVSHVIGVNIADPLLSRRVLMFNLAAFAISAFNLHATLAVVGRDREKRWMIILVYAAAVILIAVLAAFPDLFLLPSVPKMYFPNYYEPGPLNWVRMAFMFAIVVPYMIYALFDSWRRTGNAALKRQYFYFMATLIVGYAFGLIPNLLVYGIPVDPLWGIGFPLLLAVPFVYGAVRHGMMNVEIIAKQAFFYSLAVGLTGGLISILDYLDTILRSRFPAYPPLTTALISASLAVGVGALVWRRLRESDLLKYEFITTVTHKFRTPLTHIKWSVENIAKTPLSPDQQAELVYIESADAKLVELTNLLANVSEAEDRRYEYQLEAADLSVLAAEAADGLAGLTAAKRLAMTRKLETGAPVVCDAGRIRFVIQTLIENALDYTPAGGRVEVSAGRRGREAFCAVRDSGIGIAKEELPRLFSKFYRGAEARLTDTEGMGIGLYMAKEIVGRHGGRIWAESEGPDKGSLIAFALPLRSGGRPDQAGLSS